MEMIDFTASDLEENTMPFDLRLEIDGRIAEGRIVHVRVEQAMGYPAQAVIHVSRPPNIRRGWPQLLESIAGKAWRLEFTRRQEGRTSRAVYTGLVTGADVGEGEIRVQGAGFSARRAAVPRLRSWADVTVVDLVGSMLRARGIPHRFEGVNGATRLPFLMQLNEPDLAVLLRVCARQGLLCFEDAAEMVICQQPDTAHPVVLQPNELAGSGRLSVLPVPTRTEGFVRRDHPAEDVHTTYDGLQEVEGLTGLAIRSANRAYGNVRAQIGDPPTDHPEELRRFLEAGSLAAGSQAVEFCGDTDNPEVRVGRVVVLEGHSHVTEPLMVTRATVDQTPAGRYRCHFNAVPVALIGAVPVAMQRRTSGLMRGVVVDNRDPANLGRVKVHFFFNDQNAATWARVAPPAAGAEAGMTWTPQVGARVIVGFLHGDVEQPLVMGVLYDDEAPPGFTTPNGTREVNLLRTPAGATVRVEADDNGHETLTIGDRNGRASISLVLSETPSIELMTRGDLILRARNVLIKAEQSLEIGSDSSILIKAENAIKLVGTILEFQARQLLKLKGFMVRLFAQARARLKAGLIRIN